jgi:hypothetical protein
VPRWVQLVMLPLGVLALYAVAQAAGIVLLLFIVAAVIALILNRSSASCAARGCRGPPRSSPSTSPLRAAAGARLRAGAAGLRPGDGVRPRVPGLIDDTSATLDDIPRFFDDNGIDVQIKAGPTARWPRCRRASCPAAARSSPSPASCCGGSSSCRST